MSTWKIDRWQDRWCGVVWCGSSPRTPPSCDACCVLRVSYSYLVYYVLCTPRTSYYVLSFSPQAPRRPPPQTSPLYAIYTTSLRGPFFDAFTPHSPHTSIRACVHARVCAHAHKRSLRGACGMCVSPTTHSLQTRFVSSRLSCLSLSHTHAHTTSAPGIGPRRGSHVHVRTLLLASVWPANLPSQGIDAFLVAKRPLSPSCSLVQNLSAFTAELLR